MKTTKALVATAISTLVLGTAGWLGISAAADRATAGFICVTQDPVYVLNQQVTDQYQVCAPSPI